jgi:prepilin-type N-terminal cleavage/methylation domain-containing protein
MKKVNAKGGFTLIELLVVIAIIGILSSIVLVSLNSARKKGTDTRVISDVQETRTALESGYNGAGYPDLVNSATNCSAATVITAGLATLANCVNATGPDYNAINQLNTDANAEGGKLFFLVNSDLKAYAIRGQMTSNANSYFCIDSAGNTNQTDNSAVTVAGNATILASCH